MTSTQALHAQNDDGWHLVALGNLRVLVCKEDGEWLAQGVEIDYAASGDTISEAQRRFEKGLRATVHLHLTRFQSIEKLLRYAPEYVRSRLKDPKAFVFNMATLIQPDQDGDELGALPFGRIVYLTGASPLNAHSA
jgi:hypothetical protein